MIKPMALPSNFNSSGLQAISKEDETFSEVVRLIAASRERAVQSVNTALIELYWKIGETISRKIAAAEWGDAVVDRLANSSRRPSRVRAGLLVATCSE
jgi:uncharacterized protein DUF1016